MSNPYYGPYPHEDERIQWLAGADRHVQHEIWMKALERNRSEEVRAYVESPDRDAWLDELDPNECIDGAAHQDIFAAFSINFAKED